MEVVNFEGRFHVARNRTVTVRNASMDPAFSNPLLNIDPSPKLRAVNDIAGIYTMFVPQSVVDSCLKAKAGGGPRPTLNVTVFYDPFSFTNGMFDFGLRSIFAARANDNRVLINVPGNEETNNWGVGITNTQIGKLLAALNADYSNPQVKVLAAWSAGWKGMVATMRAIGQVSDLADLGNLEQVIFYDCLYFTQRSKGLVDDALSKVQKEIAKKSSRILQVVAYLVTTPGGNDSLKPQEILAGIPFLKNNNLGQGLIGLTDSARATLRKICIVRAIAWAVEDGALSQNQVAPIIRRGFAVSDRLKRNTIRSLPTLPYGKGAPSGTVDLQSFVADPRNVAISNINVNGPELAQAVNLVNAGEMIFGGTFPTTTEVDHMVIVSELGWEFVAG